MINEFITNYLSNYKNYKESWNYEDGCVLKGVTDLYDCTTDSRFKGFIEKYVNGFVNEDGSIKGFNPNHYHLDDINSGKILFQLYNETKDEKYKKAICNLYEQILIQPRTNDGNFWHKDIYPNQVWLDGLYMVMPFYIKYEKVFGNIENFKDIYNQFMNVRKLIWNDDKKLYYHGYDESRKEAWCDKVTGVSSNFWVRAEGWYVMALIDVLDEMDEELLEEFKELRDLFIEAIEGLLKYQDLETGMWYQVIDKVGESGNYLETSGTLMIAYSILKGTRLGYLPQEYREKGLKAFQGTVDKYLINKDGNIVLDGICGVAGLGNTPYRDGSYEYYLSEKIVTNDPKGVGAFLMAYSETLRK
jgi:unsaturated rhamnogalacturonyl hydrolase